MITQQYAEKKYETNLEFYRESWGQLKTISETLEQFRKESKQGFIETEMVPGRIRDMQFLFERCADAMHLLNSFVCRSMEIIEGQLAELQAVAHPPLGQDSIYDRLEKLEALLRPQAPAGDVPPDPPKAKQCGYCDGSFFIDDDPASTCYPVMVGGVQVHAMCEEGYRRYHPAPKYVDDEIPL